MSKRKKKYHFRDLDNESNLKDGKTFHAAGIAELFSPLGEPSQCGKDVSVTFIHPFTNIKEKQWRSFDEIELFEIND